MSGTEALVDAAVAAVAARLDAEIDGVVVERGRSAPVDVDRETLPRVVVRVADDGVAADGTITQLQTVYRIPVLVVGYVAGATDIEAEQAVSTLHAQVSAALAFWTPSAPGLTDFVEGGADFTVYTTDDAARPAASFTAPFSLFGIGQTDAGPWSS